MYIYVVASRLSNMMEFSSYKKHWVISFTCSKPALEIREQCVKSVQLIIKTLLVLLLLTLNRFHILFWCFRRWLWTSKYFLGFLCQQIPVSQVVDEKNISWLVRYFWLGFKWFMSASQTTFTCSKSTIETLEKGVKYVNWRRSDVFIVNFEHISLSFLVFLLFTLKL